MNSVAFNLVKNALYAREIEKRYCKVYVSVISNNFVFSKDLISSVKEILNSKERLSLKTDLFSYQLSFLLSFGVQDTCLSARKFFESFVNYTKIIKQLLKKKSIKLLILKSESLPTAIGICQVIDEILTQFGLPGKFNFYEIRILVTDTRENWRRLCGCIVDTVNSYFRNIELKLDFEENFINWTFHEFIDAIKKLNIVIIARIFGERFTQNYSFMQVALKEMKNKSILFYLDSCNESFYAAFKLLILNTNSFTEIKSCGTLKASFKDLENEQHHIDLPVHWNTEIQPVIFSTWVKGISPKKLSTSSANKRKSEQFNKTKSTKKSKEVQLSVLNSELSKLKTQVITACDSNEQNRLVTPTKASISEISKTSNISNKYNFRRRKRSSIYKKKKAKASKKHFNLNAPITVTDAAKQKAKVLTKHCNLVVSTTVNIQTDPCTESQTVEPTSKLSSSEISTTVNKQTGSAKRKRRKEVKYFIENYNLGDPTIHSNAFKPKGKQKIKVSTKLSSPKFSTTVNAQTGTAKRKRKKKVKSLTHHYNLDVPTSETDASKPKGKQDDRFSVELSSVGISNTENTLTGAAKRKRKKNVKSLVKHYNLDVPIVETDTSKSNAKHEINVTSELSSVEVSTIENKQTGAAKRKRKKKVKPLIKHNNLNVSTIESDRSKLKEKQKVKVSTKLSNPEVSTSMNTQTDAAKRKGKSQSLSKHCNLNASNIATTQPSTSKTENISHAPNINDILNTVLSILHKPGTVKSSQKSHFSDVSSAASSSQKVIPKVEKQTNSAKKSIFQNSIPPITQTIKSKKKSKATTSKISNSTGKVITPNQERETLLSKHSGDVNLTPFVIKKIVDKKTKKRESSKKCNQSNNESSASKKDCKTNSSNNVSTLASPKIPSKKGCSAKVTK